MFVIDGMDQVREVIQKNRKRKLTKHKKISNNSKIEIDHCSPLDLLKLQKNLSTLQDHEQRKSRAYKENIGKYYNMTTQVFEDEHYYICHDGRELR